MPWNRKAYRWFYDHLHSRYYNLAMKYCFLPFGGESKCRANLIADVNFSTGERILDMCCGTGGATFAIAERAGEMCQFVGTDLSSGQLKGAQKRGCPDNIRFIQSDAINTCFNESQFDKVFITHALHEMTVDDQLKTLIEAKRVLKNRGKVIILELDNPANPWIRLFVGLWFLYWLPFNFETSTRKDMIRRGLAGEVEEAGYKNVRKFPKYLGVFQVITGENLKAIN